MKDFETKEFKPFELFNSQWGLVTAGTPEHFNTMTIAWGSLGTIWGHLPNGKPIVSVYVNPLRYTWEFLTRSDTFTVSFFPQEYKKALAYLGAHSGRDGNKIAAAGLTPETLGQGVAFKEADLVFLCRKIYQDSFKKENMAQDIQDFYGDYPAHWLFIGEVLDVKDLR